MNPKELKSFLLRTDRTGDCWIWTGGKTYNGYGVTCVSERQTGAHRAAFSHWNGPIADSMEIHHSCKVKLCVNPEHLKSITHAQHMRLHFAKPKIEKVQIPRTHCESGKHEWAKENIRVSRSGCKKCRLCDNQRHKIKYHLRVAAQFN